VSVPLGDDCGFNSGLILPKYVLAWFVERYATMKEFTIIPPKDDRLPKVAVTIETATEMLQTIKSALQAHFMPFRAAYPTISRPIPSGTKIAKVNAATTATRNVSDISSSVKSAY
jgi:hypothetical protein